MGLPWVRLDTGFTQNPKILNLILDKKWQSVVVYTAALGYSGQHGTDGFIPITALTLLHGTKRNATDLINEGLWIPHQGSYEINDWSEFQQSSDETKARKLKAQKAAEIRWSKYRKEKEEAAV